MSDGGWFISPAASDVYNITDNMVIKWFSPTAGSQLDLYFSQDNGVTWSTSPINSSAIVSTGGEQQYSWIIPDNIIPVGVDQASNYRFKVVDRNDPKKSAISQAFTIRGRYVIAPATGAQWLVTIPHTIQWVLAGAANVDISYWNGNGNPTLIAANVSNTGGTGSYSWTIPSGFGSNSIWVCDHAGTAGCTHSPAISPFPDPNKWYKIVSKCRAPSAPDSEYCIDIVGGQCDLLGDSIHLWQYKATTNQQWKFNALSGGYFDIVTRGGTSGLGINDPFGVTENGTQLGIWSTNGVPNQEWMLHDDGDGYFKIKSYAGNTAVIDLDSSKVKAGRRLQEWNLTTLDDTTSKDKWQIIEVP
jgi:hypothetical protein